MEATILVALILAAVLVYVLRIAAAEHQDHHRAIAFVINEGRKEREFLTTRIHELASEMATREAHPEVVSPNLLRSVPQETEPDVPPEFEKVGRIFPASDNGDEGA